MKKCLGLVLIGLSSVSNGEGVTVSLRSLSVVDQDIQQTMQEIESMIQQSPDTTNAQEDMEGIERILHAFVRMIGGVAHAMMYHNSPNSQAAALSGMSTIFINTLKVIAELAEHRRPLIDVGSYEPINRKTQAQYTLEAMERELLNAAQEAPQDDQKPPANIDPTKQLIATNVANIIEHCANIIADPRNPQVLGSNIGHMLASAITIAAQFQKRGVSPLHITHEEMHKMVVEDEVLCDYLLQVIQQQAGRAHLLRLAAGYCDAVS